MSINNDKEKLEDINGVIKYQKARQYNDQNDKQRITIDYTVHHVYVYYYEGLRYYNVFIIFPDSHCNPCHPLSTVVIHRVES